MERMIHMVLLAGLCVFLQNISCEYVLIQQQKTWDDAQAYCRQNFMGHLVTVANAEDWTHIKQAVEPALTAEVWTGLYNDINSWRWSYQDENTTFVYWGSDSPNNYAGVQECAILDNKTFNDIDCSHVYPFFCYNETETNDSFILISSFKENWYKAQNYCRQHHTDLATIRTKTEYNLLIQMKQDFQLYGRVWIGLFRDSWKWSDGTKISMSSINWASSTRDITGKNRPCGSASPDGLIDDRMCSDPLPFICESYSKKQIVRLEVKSGRNVNDPAVMENILQSIKQKLKDLGIGEHKGLTWRQQPHGSVFTLTHGPENIQNVG